MHVDLLFSWQAPPEIPGHNADGVPRRPDDQEKLARSRAYRHPHRVKREPLINGFPPVAHGEIPAKEKSPTGGATRPTGTQARDEPGKPRAGLRSRLGRCRRLSIIPSHPFRVTTQATARSLHADTTDPADRE